MTACRGHGRKWSLPLRAPGLDRYGLAYMARQRHGTVLAFHKGDSLDLSSPNGRRVAPYTGGRGLATILIVRQTSGTRP